MYQCIFIYNNLTVTITFYYTWSVTIGKYFTIIIVRIRSSESSVKVIIPCSRYVYYHH